MIDNDIKPPNQYHELYLPFQGSILFQTQTQVVLHRDKNKAALHQSYP